MKKFIRVLIKIPVTPIIVLFCVFILAMGYITIFVEWLFDSSDWNKEITKKVNDFIYGYLKHWFTTI